MRSSRKLAAIFTASIFALTATACGSDDEGGEDFGWYLGSVPGAMARLGGRTPGGPTYDLHQGDLRVDDRSIGIGARVLATAAAVALREARPGPGDKSR